VPCAYFELRACALFVPVFLMCDFVLGASFFFLHKKYYILFPSDWIQEKNPLCVFSEKKRPKKKMTQSHL
jgi:hypothetical protein